MQIYFIFLKNTARESVNAHLNASLRRCDVMNQWVLDRDNEPVVYVDWYDDWAQEWSPEAMADIQAQLGKDVAQTTLLARLSSRHGTAADVQTLFDSLLAQFEGLAQDEDGVVRGSSITSLT
jgi:hypothetical protein